MSKLNFISYLKTLKPEDWNKKVNDQRTVKDVAAHMVSWEKEDTTIIGLTWKTKKIPWFCETDDYEDFNNKHIEYYKDYAPEQIIKEWRKYQKQVQEEIDSIGEDNLKKYPDLFKWLLEKGEGSHYELHYKEIRDVVKKY